MAKYLLTDAYVSINGVDLSDHAFSIDTPDTKEQVDVSGFNSAGNKEFLPGQREQTVTIGLLQDFASNKVHATLQPLYEGGSAFPIIVRAKSSAGSATNPSFSGTVSLFEYNGLNGQLNARGDLNAVFKPANNSTLSWGTL
jgi:hypothetical protein